MDDWKDLFYYALALLWLLQPVLRRLFGKDKDEEPPSAPAPAPAPQREPPRPRGHTPGALPKPAPSREPPGVRKALEDLARETQATQDSLDPRLREAFSGELDGVRARLEQRRDALDSFSRPATDAGAVDVASLRDGLANDRETVAALRSAAVARNQPSMAQAHALADRILAELCDPVTSTLRSPGSLEVPLVPVVADRSVRDRLGASRIQASLALLPSQLVSEPWLWLWLGQEVGWHIQGRLPSLAEEMHGRLRLDIEQTQQEGQANDLARILFSSWLPGILADWAGGLLFGPAYLRMLIYSWRSVSPQQANRVLQSQDGSLLPVPPPFIRALLLGDAEGSSDPAPELQAWRKQKSAQGLEYWNGAAVVRLPVQSLEGPLLRFHGQLRSTPLDCLGGRSLAQLPGLAGWSQLAPQAATAAEALRSGNPAKAPARALLAGAALAALGAPDQARRVHALLQGAPSAPGLQPHAAGRSSPEAASPGDVPQVRRLTEALVLAELLRSPRTGRL